MREKEDVSYICVVLIFVGLLVVFKFSLVLLIEVFGQAKKCSSFLRFQLECLGKTKYKGPKLKF